MPLLGYLLLRNGATSLKQLKSSSSSSRSSWSLLWRGIIINSSSYSSNCFTTSDSDVEDRIKPHHHPYLLSTPPCLLIPSPENEYDYKEEVIAAIKNEEGRFPDYCFYNLVDRKVVKLNNVRSKSNIVIPDHALCVGSSHGWLAYLDPDDHFTVYLTNPLVSPVPPTICLPPLEKFSPNPHPWWAPRAPFIDKLAMSSSPSNNEDCTVMVIERAHRGHGRVLFCKLGDSSWTVLQKPDEYPRELAYSSKDRLFYCQDLYDTLKACNLRHPRSPREIDIKTDFGDGLPFYSGWEMKLRDTEKSGKDYLVVESSSGDVLLVTRYSAHIAKDGIIVDRDRHDICFVKTLRFDVYRLNVPQRSWDYVTDLGDGVLFLGKNQSFQLSAGDFAPGVLIPNSIYFTPDTDGENNITDTGIYNMQDFTIKSLFPSHLHRFNNIRTEHFPYGFNNIHTEPLWFTPNPMNNLLIE